MIQRISDRVKSNSKNSLLKWQDKYCILVNFVAGIISPFMYWPFLKFYRDLLKYWTGAVYFGGI